MKATRGRDLSPLQVESILNRLLQDYPETVSRWAVGVIAEPPEMARLWLLAAADRCLLKYWRQVAIEEELSRLLSPPPTRSDSFREVHLPSNPFILSEAGNAGPVM